MKNVLRKYSGVVFFYITIVGMILLVSARFDYLEEKNISSNTYAMAE